MQRFFSRWSHAATYTLTLYETLCGHGPLPSCRLLIPVIHIEISYKTPIDSFFWKVMKSVEIEKASVLGRNPERKQVQVKKTEQKVFGCN